MRISPVNMFMLQSGPDGYVLNMGHALPPILPDPPQPITSVAVHVVARILVTPGTADALVQAMTDISRQHDEDDATSTS